jgi:hypothetical protein
MKKKLIVYPKDIMVITGRSKSYAYRLADQIRKKNGKDKSGLILLREFCEFTGLKEADIIAHIQ